MDPHLGIPKLMIGSGTSGADVEVEEFVVALASFRRFWTNADVLSLFGTKHEGRSSSCSLVALMPIFMSANSSSASRIAVFHDDADGDDGDDGEVETTTADISALEVGAASSKPE